MGFFQVSGAGPTRRERMCWLRHEGGEPGFVNDPCASPVKFEGVLGTKPACFAL